MKSPTSMSIASPAIVVEPSYNRTAFFSRIAECNVKNHQTVRQSMRKRHVKKAGKKLDAEARAVVWPELFETPRVRITSRERKAAKLKKSN
jgi:hypothetical protein